MDPASQTYLTQIFMGTLSGNEATQKQATQQLNEILQRNDAAFLLLQYIQCKDVQDSYKLASAIQFKNYVKDKWSMLDESFKGQIRDGLFNFMLTSSQRIGKILSQAIADIAKTDFPDEWGTLLQQFVANLQQYPLQTLETSRKVFKKYRSEFRSDKLWFEIDIVVKNLSQPFYNLTAQVYTNLTNNVDVPLNWQILLHICHVFWSLNAQDIPQYFFETLNQWMGLFKLILTYQNQQLSNDDLFKVKSVCVKCISLYANKYSEEFTQYCQEFVNTTCQLVLQSKYDKFNFQAMMCLQVIANQNSLQSVFENILPDVLKFVVLPNLKFLESDEDMYQTSPQEYLKLYIEDADQLTRRNAAMELFRSLINVFNSYTFEKFLVPLTNQPSSTWQDKEACLYMWFKGLTTNYNYRYGATTKLNDSVIVQVFTSFVLPVLQTGGQEFLKAAAFKYILIYRNQLVEQLSIILPLTLQHCQSEHLLVASTAAAVLERLLMIKNKNDQSQLLIQSNNLIGELKAYLTILNQGLSLHQRNSFLMKAFFRVLWHTQFELSTIIQPLTQLCCDYLQILLLNTACEIQYQSYLFETIALVIKSLQQNSEAAFKDYLNMILQKQINSLFSYCLQLYAQIINETKGLTANTLAILSEVILKLDYWDAQQNRQNIPGLTCFLIAALKHSPQTFNDKVVLLNQIVRALFTRIQTEGIIILNSMMEYLPQELLTPILKDNLIAIMSLVQIHKQSITSKFFKNIVLLFSFWLLKRGPEDLKKTFDMIQPQIFKNFTEKVIVDKFKTVDTVLERKFVACSFTLLMPNLENETWAVVVANLISMLEMKSNSIGGVKYGNLIDLPDEYLQSSDLNLLVQTQTELIDRATQVYNEKAFLLQNIKQTAKSNDTASFLMQYQNQIPELQSTLNILQAWKQSYGIIV